MTVEGRGAVAGGWPGRRSSQHADDAAALLSALGLCDVTVVGASAGAIVALQFALRHPEQTGTTLCYEPGCFSVVPGGIGLQQRSRAAVKGYLELHPGDWAGAAAALGQAAVESTEASAPSLFTPPPDHEWYAVRAEGNAESLIRGDIPLTGESVDDEEVAACSVNLRFAAGTRSLPIFQMIATRLAATRGTTPDFIQGVGHSLFCHSEATASYIRDRMVRT